MKQEIVLVTPKMAAELLKGNTDNRKLRNTVVKAYAEEMKNGNWQLSHQGIAIANDGTLIDGQHRLHAVVLSGVSVFLSVATGCERSQFSIVDFGAKRTYSDVTGIPADSLTTAKKILQNAHAGDKRSRVSPFDIAKIHEKYEAVVDLISRSAVKSITASVRAGMVAYIVGGGDAEKAKSFIRFVKHGNMDGVTAGMSNVAMRIINSGRDYKDSLACSVDVYKSLLCEDMKVIRSTDRDVSEYREICKSICSFSGVKI